MKISSKNVLVTGLSGHLGLAILMSFIEHNNNPAKDHEFKVFGTVRTEASLKTMLKLLEDLGDVAKGIYISQLDLTTRNLEKENLWGNDFDIVIHSAAMLGTAGAGKAETGKQVGDKFSPKGFYSSNVMGTARFYEVLSSKSPNLSKLIYISSGDVYGGDGIIKESELPRPKSAYALNMGGKF